MQYQEEIFAQLIKDTDILTPEEKKGLMEALPDMPESQKEMLMDFFTKWNKKLDDLLIRLSKDKKEKQRQEKVTKLYEEHEAIESEARKEAEELILKELL